MGTMEEKERTHHRETHGRSSDVIESISIDKVKGPNVFERAKEEIEALVDTIRSNKNHDHDNDHYPRTKKDEKKVEAPNLHDKSKEESEVDIHIVKEKVHKRETHGKSNDVDENTPLNKIKGPNIFQRAKEEIEAIAGTIHPRTEPDLKPQEETQENFWGFFARLFEKICSPHNAKRD
ncbi:uncharacterized protein LOC109722196 [Ananas comosus]|uniref:Uncharacterized protein LOC109722196 n=1 Tax=Ananas comosus TaxID=4615 RepID=A0A199VE25_ANACO|nr:uncharacterized protein LOC109722196 [Ananas comosus]OAY75367.1 hypothetical protein ACMD2_01870 [Ananas comosus]